jgi:osmotically-inducible protein OsmY
MRTRSWVLPMLIAGLSIGALGMAHAQVEKQDLKRRIEASLSPYIMHKISVETTDSGAVTIRGDVDALYDRLDIYQIVSHIRGVTSIKDLLVVETLVVPDETITANILRTIKDNAVILEPDKISVTVNDGMVFLRGTVSYGKEKLMATTIASWQDGVKGVENEIEVLPPQEAVQDENIKSILQEIVVNHFPLIEHKIRIDVTNGNVTLEGNVERLWDKDHLKEEFLQVPGVRSVVEHFSVTP